MVAVGYTRMIKWDIVILWGAEFFYGYWGAKIIEIAQDSQTLLLRRSYDVAYSSAQ